VPNDQFLIFLGFIEARLRTHFGPGAQYQLRRTGFGLARWFELTTIEKKEYWQ
jgi:hypothetical protein